MRGIQARSCPPERTLEQVLGDDIDPPAEYIAEFAYGANDGIVTTFAVVAEVAGAALDPAIVLVLGAANLLAVEPLFPLSVPFTGVAFFVVGASRSLVTARSWLHNGGEMFAVGMLAAGVAFAVGTLLKGLV